MEDTFNRGSVTINPDESIQTGGQTEGNIHVHNNGSASKSDENKRVSNNVQLPRKDATANETSLRYSGNMTIKPCDIVI